MTLPIEPFPFLRRDDIMHESDFHLKAYIPDGSELIFKGSRISMYTKKTGASTKEIIAHPGAVVILPLLDNDQIVLIRNDRIAIGEVLWELPAGTLEEGEHPEATAKRELQEETGYLCQHLTPLTFFYTTPGFCNERMFAYIATQLSAGPQHLDEGEKITVETFSWNTTEKMLRNGEIKDAKTIAALLFYKTFKNDL
jgi:ADP-ribose pyrophosphatase